MTRPYSKDLQERAVARVEAGESVRVVARALSLGLAAVARDGSAAAEKMGGHRPRLLVGARLESRQSACARRRR
ncbi:MAG: hypothetical protein CR217_15295 [Beijerinckiaceae bacterium]|nr:MAG: hypothetical protein CR217_15295 [Beijerinckiaceae bacterium]